MDPANVMTILRRTLDPQTQPEAENELNKIKKIIGFAPILLQIIMAETNDGPIRQAAAIFFKNLVLKHWTVKEYDVKVDGTTMPFDIHEQDKTIIRDNIIDGITRIREFVLQSPLASCISTITKHDFPGRWPQVVDKISIYLQTPEPSGWPGALLALHQLVKNYEYKKTDERAPLYDALNLILPQVYNVLTHCSNNDSQEFASIRKQIFKTFFALTQYTLPLGILNNDSFTKWMEVFNNALLSPIPASANDVDPEERPLLIWWKEKKWALKILTRLFDRYGSPGNTMNEYKEFSEWYIKTFSRVIMETILKLLASMSSGTYVSPRVTQKCLNYIHTGVSHALTWKFIKPHMEQIIKDVIFPLMCYTKEDDELWKSDPYEYIRIKFDIFEDFVSPVTAAQSLLYALCTKRKNALPLTMDFVMNILRTPETPSAQIDGALHMIGSLADVLLKKKQYKGELEGFLMHIVFPLFPNEHAHLRARSCWMLQHFSDVKFKNPDVLVNAFKSVIDSLLRAEEDIPVKVEAAIALQMLLSHQEEIAHPVVVSQIGDITMALLEIIRDTENDDLANVLQKIVCSFTNELVPMATNICSHLVNTFAQVIETGDSGDDKVIAAMGLLNTMETLLSVMEDKEDVYVALEPIVLQAVHFIFANKQFEFYEEALSISVDLTLKNISPRMWEMLALLYEVFEGDGRDYFIEMMPLLHNYITVGGDQFLANPSYLTTMYNMAKTMFETDPGEDPESHAAKLLEVIILQFKGKNIDAFVSSAVTLALNRLGRNVLTSELRTMCLQVAISAMYYNPELFFGLLQQAGASSGTGDANAYIRQFIEQWISDTDCFLGLHDRKICIIGICSLINGPEIPGVRENAAKLLPSLIILFEGLRKVYENLESSSDEDSDSGDDDNESVDGECLESDEDEINEESSMYLEGLQDKVRMNTSNLQANLSNMSNMSNMGNITADITTEDYDDDDDDSLFEGNSLDSYTTPLDEEESGVDEYEIFKGLLQQLEKNGGEWYSMLVSSLTADHQKKIKEIMTYSDQRKAMKESKLIEKAGGYNFQQQTMPSQFTFGSDSKNFSFGK